MKSRVKLVVSVVVAVIGVAACVADDPNSLSRSSRNKNNETPPPFDPGRVTLRRLNNTEYCNTVHDLLGTSQRPCDKFPKDGVAHGFDTNADTQSVSALHIEMYEQAAEDLVQEIMALSGGDPRRTKILTCSPKPGPADPCALDILTRFATRAWRRPVAADELAGHAGLLKLASDQGGSAEDGVGLALKAVLLSPNFLFRVEIDPDPASPTPHKLSDYELATRLSYALWSSMPDDELMAAAGKNALQDPAGLAQQVERMLKDPRAHALTANFAGQWLESRDLPDHEIDPAAFPSFDPALRTSMKQEMDLFFDEFVRQSHKVGELLTADFTFVDDRLATHYGIPSPGTSQPVRVSLANSNRRGILAQAGLLTATSYPNRTSAVRRGVFALDKLLCSRPAPPPPGVAPLTPPGDTSTLTMREQLAAHRQRPQCAACHNAIDPIGLGLESFDGIGRFRSTDQNKPIDSSGQLPDGRTFSGPTELAALLAKDPSFEQCVTQQFLTYILGHVIDDVNGSRAWIANITETSRAAGGSFNALIKSSVTSQAFTMRRGEAGAKQ